MTRGYSADGGRHARKWHPPPAERELGGKPSLGVSDPWNSGARRTLVSGGQSATGLQGNTDVGMALPDLRESHTYNKCHKSHSCRHNPCEHWGLFNHLPPVQKVCVACPAPYGQICPLSRN